MLQQFDSIDLFLQIWEFFQTVGDIPSLAILFASTLSIIGCLAQFLIQFCNIDILSFDPLKRFLVFRLMLLNLLHQVFITGYRHLSIVLLHLDQASLRLDQFLMLFQLFLPE